jgi:hypothetical protein
MFKVNHLMNEKLPKRIMYNIIKRAENGITAKRKLGSVLAITMHILY